MAGGRKTVMSNQCLESECDLEGITESITVSPGPGHSAADGRRRDPAEAEFP